MIVERALADNEWRGSSMSVEAKSPEILEVLEGF